MNNNNKKNNQAQQHIENEEKKKWIFARIIVHFSHDIGVFILYFNRKPPISYSISNEPLSTFMLHFWLLPVFHTSIAVNIHIVSNRPFNCWSALFHPQEA